MVQSHEVALLLIALLACQPEPPARPEDPAPKIGTVLLADRAAVSPGGALTLALRLSLPEGWHVYWTNPGETGLATSADLQAPAGFSASGPLWPGPERFVSPGDITAFGYAGEAWVIWTLQAPGTLAAGPFAFTAQVDWLACKELCVKGAATVSLTLPTGPDAPGSDLSAALARLPRPAASWPGAALSWSEDRRAATVSVPGATDLLLFPGADLELALESAEVRESGRDRELRIQARSEIAGMDLGVLRVSTPSGPPLYLDLNTFTP